MQLKFFLLNIDCFKASFELLVLLMNPLFALISISLKCLSLMMLCLKSLELCRQVLTFLAGLILLLLANCAPLLQKLDLLVCIFYFRLANLYPFLRMLIYLSKGHEPVANLLQETIGFP